MSKENILLQWNDFQKNISTSVAEERRKVNQQIMSYLTDVTLVCEDGTNIQTHRIVLSVSSYFFKELITDNTDSHITINLPEVKSRDLKLVLDFIYRRTAIIDKSEISSFLSLAIQLQVTGLENSSEIQKTFESSILQNTLALAQFSSPNPTANQIQNQATKNPGDKTISDGLQSAYNQTKAPAILPDLSRKPFVTEDVFSSSLQEASSPHQDQLVTSVQPYETNKIISRNMIRPKTAPGPGLQDFKISSFEPKTLEELSQSYGLCV